MAKQRRTKPTSSSSKKRVQIARVSKGRARPRREAPAPQLPPPPSPHLDAIAIYERGVRALQAREYGSAAEILQSVIDRYPDEKELHERARLYLNVIRRQTAPLDSTPKSSEERVYAVTLAINRGAYDDALAALTVLRDEIPDDDRVQYMLAVAHAQRGELSAALSCLERAVALDPENRAFASQDADLEPLRRDPMFRTILERAPAPRDRRVPPRGRSPR
jgi:tetratricopeptide (TPR) repeat protein